MSLSLRTGEVLNLTNGTSGAAWVNDQHPSLSADGMRAAFTFTDGWSDVWAMDATTGFNAGRLTDDEWTDTAPVFSADGASVVYSSYRGPGSGATVDADGSVTVRPEGWVVVRRDLNSNTETLLSDPSQPSALQPEVDPSGTWVYFLSLTPGGPRIAGATGWNCGAVHRDRRPARIDRWICDDRTLPAGHRTRAVCRRRTDRRPGRPGSPALRCDNGDRQLEHGRPARRLPRQRRRRDPRRVHPPGGRRRQRFPGWFGGVAPYPTPRRHADREPGEPRVLSGQQPGLAVLEPRSSSS